jgi:exopolysaccharide production protein ExoZ
MKSKLLSLEAGRGIAALLVVLFHCWHHCREAYGDFWLGRLFDFGHAGVDFFFVLSGFIILHAHRRDIGESSRLLNYVRRRFTRIYPIYWVIFAVTLVVLSMSSGAFPSDSRIAVSALLLPTRDFPIMADTWTLQHEILFYSFFGVLIWNRNLGAIAFGVWLIALIAARLGPVPSQIGLVLRLTSSFDFEFFFGMAAAWISKDFVLPAPKLFAAAGFLSFLAVGTAENTGVIHHWSFFTHLGYGISAAVLVSGLAAWERRGAMRFPAPLVVLGDSSYTLYLVHVLVVGILWQLLMHLGIEHVLPAWVTYSFLVAGSIAVALVVRYAVERPIIALLRRLLNRRSSQVPAMVAGYMDCE